MVWAWLVILLFIGFSFRLLKMIMSFCSKSGLVDWKTLFLSCNQHKDELINLTAVFNIMLSRNKKRLNHMWFCSAGYCGENLSRDCTGIGELSHSGRYESTSKFELSEIPGHQLPKTLGVADGVWRRRWRSNFKYSCVPKSDLTSQHTRGRWWCSIDRAVGEMGDWKF